LSDKPKDKVCAGRSTAGIEWTPIIHEK